MANKNKLQNVEENLEKTLIKLLCCNTAETEQQPAIRNTLQKVDRENYKKEEKERKKREILRHCEAVLKNDIVYQYYLSELVNIIGDMTVAEDIADYAELLQTTGDKIEDAMTSMQVAINNMSRSVRNF